MKKLGILGCGWLGTKLAVKLNSQKWNVKVSKTSTKGVISLGKQGIDSYRIILSENSIKGDLEFFENLDQLLISIPPKRDSIGNFSKKINYLINFLKSKSNTKIIFLSSTSVYGKRNGKFNEQSILFPDTDSSSNLVISEKMIQKSSNPSIIIRLGGLVGEDRNPIFHLNKKIITNPEGVINFIHHIDAVNGIFKLLSCSQAEGVFNLVSPHHPKRKDFYLKMAEKYSLSLPKFTENDPTIIRLIEAKKIKTLTGFNYQVDNLLI